MKTHVARHRRQSRALSLSDQTGSIMIIALAFILVFAILGVALQLLITSQTRATETERTDIKAFNVSEAGVDAGMLSLKLAWPRSSTKLAAVDSALLKTVLQQSGSDLWDPSRSPVTDFLQVRIYDNIDPATGLTTTVANSSAPRWDSNQDGKMFVDSVSNVDDDRHRILVLAERQLWDFAFPTKIALWADKVNSNGQGLEINFENGHPPAYYDVHDPLHKGVDIPDPSMVIPATPAPFSSVFSEQMRSALENVARNKGTYFDGANAGPNASIFLNSGKTYGAIVYVKSNSAVTLNGQQQIGSVEQPCVLIIDTPSNIINVWNYRGDLGFFGLLITIGNNSLQGWNGIHGAMYCSQLLSNEGNGRAGEINYNQQVIENINQQYVISVNIVPNTWEEYTLPVAAN